MNTRTATTWAVMMASLALTVAPVDSAVAGRREWARAGQILTGYVLVRTLIGDPLQPLYHRRDRGPVYGPVHACCMGRGPRVCAAPVPVYGRTSDRRTPPPGDPPERWVDRGGVATYAPARAAGETEPLIVPLRDGRRLFQSGPAGSPAYVQRWSETDEAWISVARMPSLR